MNKKLISMNKVIAL